MRDAPVSSRSALVSEGPHTYIHDIPYLTAVRGNKRRRVMFLGPVIGRLIPTDAWLNDGGRSLHYKCPPSGVPLASGHLNHRKTKSGSGVWASRLREGNSSGVMINLVRRQSLLKLRWIWRYCNKDKGLSLIWQRPRAPKPGKGWIPPVNINLRCECVCVWELLRGFICRTTRRPVTGEHLEFLFKRSLISHQIRRRPGPPSDRARLLRLQPVRNCDATVIEIICQSFSEARLIWTEVNGTELSINGHNPSSSTFPNHNCWD